MVGAPPPHGWFACEVDFDALRAVLRPRRTKSNTLYTIVFPELSFFGLCRQIRQVYEVSMLDKDGVVGR